MDGERIQMKLIPLLCLCLGAASFAAPAAAAQEYSCTGRLDWLSVSPNGIVTVSSQSSQLGVFYVCNVNSTRYSVTPANCSSILATLLTAKAMGSQVTWNFDDSLNCN